MFRKVLFLLLFLVLSVGCVHTHSYLVIQELKPHERYIGVKGQAQLRRSFIYDNWDIKDGMVMFELIKRTPILLLTLPLQIMAYEDKDDVKMEHVVDLDSGTLKNPHIYFIPYLCKDFKVCDVVMSDDRNATFMVRNGSLYMRIMGISGMVCEKVVYEYIYNKNGWLLVDEDGLVVYIRSQSSSSSCDLFYLDLLPLLSDDQRAREQRARSEVVYRFSWQSCEFEPIVKLGYGELINCKGVNGRNY